jgi:hypothetical protein
MTGPDTGASAVPVLSPAAPDPDILLTSLRKMEHDIRISRGLLIAGVITLTTCFILILTGTLTRLVPNFSTAALLGPPIEGTGGVFILVGGFVAAISWSLLRRSRKLLPT